MQSQSGIKQFASAHGAVGGAVIMELHHVLAIRAQAFQQEAVPGFFLSGSVEGIDHAALALGIEVLDGIPVNTVGTL